MWLWKHPIKKSGYVKSVPFLSPSSFLYIYFFHTLHEQSSKHQQQKQQQYPDVNDCALLFYDNYLTHKHSLILCSLHVVSIQKKKKKKKKIKTAVKNTWLVYKKTPTHFKNRISWTLPKLATYILRRQRKLWLTKKLQQLCFLTKQLYRSQTYNNHKQYCTWLEKRMTIKSTWRLEILYMLIGWACHAIAQYLPFTWKHLLQTTQASFSFFINHEHSRV